MVKFCQEKLASFKIPQKVVMMTGSGASNRLKKQTL